MIKGNNVGIRLFTSLFFISIPSLASDLLYVSSTSELYKAVNLAHKEPKIKKIVLAPGIYHLGRRITLKRDQLTLVGEKGPKDTVLTGKGMRKSRSPEVLIDVLASHITVGGITLKNSGNHLIQVRAENNADFFHLKNSILQDSYEQMLKVSGDKSASHYSDNGIVEHCVFEYTAGIGP